MTEQHYDQLLDRLDRVRRRGDQADARCPAHEDNRASLSVARGRDNRVLITCHAGCRWQDVLGAVGMEPGDAFGAPRLVREYTYTDAAGIPLYVVERWEPKTFRQRLASGARRAPRDADRVIYNLPMIASVRAGTKEPGCFYVEGEKDVETLVNQGYAATTTLGGANKPWPEQYTDQLAGMNVVIVADQDAPGRRWAHAVAEHLDGHARTTIVVPPNGYKDVTELLEGGGSVAQLIPLPNTIGEVMTAAEIPTKTVSWVWPGRIPAHMLTLLEGDPGTGKSTLVSEIVACLTTGRPLPATDRMTRRQPMRIAMLADEDNWSMTVVPRLKAAGADLGRVFRLAGIRTEGYLAPYSLGDLATLRHDLRAVHAELLIIDPLMAYFGGRDVDTHKDQHVRSILGPLVQIAEEDGLTIVAIRHFTKGSVGDKAIYRGGGSIGFTGQARAILQTGEHPDQAENPNQYVLAVAKCNLAPLEMSIGYQIGSDPIYDVARVRWDDVPVTITAQQLHCEPDRKAQVTGVGKTALEWLAAFLAPGDRSFTWAEIVAAGKEAGHSEHTLRNYREVVAVQAIGHGGRASARWHSNGHLPVLAGDTNPRQEVAHGNDDRAPDFRERAFKDDDDAEPTTPDSHMPPLAYGLRPGDGMADGPTMHLSTGSPTDVDDEESLSGEFEAHAVIEAETECRICGSADSVVTYPEGGRCRLHYPNVWREP